MKIRRPSHATSLLVALVVSLTTVTAAHAIDSCKVKVDKRTGVILVDATNVVGTLQWGNESGQETHAIFNSGTCVAAGKAKKCQIGDPLTLASKTPPAGCTLYLDDGTAPCSTWIPGCTPSPRGSAGGILKDSAGVVVGYSADQNAQYAIRDEAGVKLRLTLQTDGSGFLPIGYLYFTSNDCTGTPLMGADGNMVKTVTILSNTTGLYAQAMAANQNVQSILYAVNLVSDQAGCDSYFGMGITTFVAPHACCGLTMFTAPMAATVNVNLAQFVPPFHLEIP